MLHCQILASTIYKKTFKKSYQKTQNKTPTRDENLN